jgi:hypothetical protein
MRKVLLVILDGWGHSDFQGDPDPGNAIELADVPRFRALYASAPKTRLACSGADVGLPDGQMGNSEVGHLNLGAGRIVYQDIARVDKAIADGALADKLDLDRLVEGLGRTAARCTWRGSSRTAAYTHICGTSRRCSICCPKISTCGCTASRTDVTRLRRGAWLPRGDRACLRQERAVGGGVRDRPVLGHGPGPAVGPHQARLRPHRSRRSRGVGRRHGFPHGELRGRRHRRVRGSDRHPRRGRARAFSRATR